MNAHKAKFRLLLAGSMVAIGLVHFLSPAGFVSIVPPWLPAPLVLVLVSGFFEIAGGVGLLIPRVRRAAGIGLILLYLAVFPANIHMAASDVQPTGFHIPEIVLWIRLPFQALFIVWAWWCSRESDTHANEGAPARS
jgi:uncharacterized membrane protein